MTMTTLDMFIPQPLPVVDTDDCNDFSDDLFDPLPLNAQNGSDLLILSDLLMMEEALMSPKRVMKRLRRVSFQDHPTRVSVPSFACFPEAERRGLWYQPAEIDKFRTTARQACRVLRKNPYALPAEVTRGLELRTSQNRQMRKHLALACIVKAQRRYPNIDPLHLAAIADRCTALPRQEALLQGTRDFCDAYSSFLPLTPEPEPVFQSLKRVVVYDIDHQDQGPMMKRRRVLGPQETQVPLLTVAF